MPRTYVLQREQHFRQTRAELFPFFANAGNLSAITPEFLHFKILTPMPIEMRSGARLDYRLRLFGIPVLWKTRIEAFDAPLAFVDRQIEGPYRLWHHTHVFEAIEGGTRMRDVVRYQLPCGPLGRLAHAVLIRRTLRRIFDHRADALRRIFGDVAMPREPGVGSTERTEGEPEAQGKRGAGGVPAAARVS